MPAGEVILAIDLGTSSVKTLLVTPEGAVAGRGQTPYPTMHPQPGWHEQAPDAWMHATAMSAREARLDAPDATIRAVVVTGQMHGTVLLDAHGAHLGPAVIWSDRRTADLAATGGPYEQVEALMALIGGPLGAGYQALTLAWIRHQQRDTWSRIAHVLLPVDYVLYRLTGQMVTDPANAVSTGLLNAHTGTWDPSLLEAGNIPVEWLPAVAPPGTTAGPLSMDAAADLELPAGIPVLHGSGDAPAAAIGARVHAPHEAMVVLSTGAQVIRPVDTYRPDADGRWHTWPSALPAGMPGANWLAVGALLNGGRAIDWIHRTLMADRPVKDLIDLAANAPAGAGGLLFLPYLAGERSPLLDPRASGAFVGLQDAHEPRHLARAVLEGIALALADTLDRMTGATDAPQSLVFGGGGATPLLGQMLADATGIPVLNAPTNDLSAHGAATIALHALGWTRSADCKTAHPSSSPIAPAPSAVGLRTERLALFREATTSLLPLMHRLGDP